MLIKLNYVTLNEESQASVSHQIFIIIILFWIAYNLSHKLYEMNTANSVRIAVAIRKVSVSIG